MIRFFLLLALLGCGGGGGGGGGSTTPNKAPVADAGPDQSVTLASPDTLTITLTGTSRDTDGTVVSHRWVQTGGADVILTGATTSTATFTVPAATQAYAFTYTVTDNDGAQHSDSVSVYATKTLFSELFADGGGWSARWTIGNDTGNPDAWAVNNAELRQTNHLESGSLQTSYHTGTYAFLVDPAVSGISAYRFSVDITPLTNTTGSTQGNDVGIMFRYQNANNYYRVSMSARYGFTRFEKRQNGNFQTLGCQCNWVCRQSADDHDGRSQRRHHHCDDRRRPDFRCGGFCNAFGNGCPLLPG